MNDLSAFAKNTHSQSGEDGVLAEIFARLDISQGVFCEFGAWDGKHLSNCYSLYEKGWGGWYIEGSQKRFSDLKRNITFARVEPICSFVRPEGPDSLDAILSRSRLFRAGVKDIDLLSIDIDSDDLAVWRGIKTFRPKVVIIEFNPTIPTDVYFENTPGRNWGNSPLSIYEFARSIDYGLVSVVGANLIFIDQRLQSSIPTINLAATGPRYFFGYDGTLFVTKAGHGAEARHPEIIKVPWVGGVFPQPVDMPLRRFDSGRYVRTAVKIWSRFKLALTNPVSAVRNLAR